MTEPTYPPTNDRLTHLIAQELNTSVGTWKFAFWLAQNIVKDPSVQAELQRISQAHTAGQPCSDQNCAACFGAATDPTPAEPSDPQRGELWSLLDWTFWGSGMGDVFREPLADTMTAAISPEQREQAEKLMEAWHASGRQPLGRRRYEDLNAELKEAQRKVERLDQMATAWAERLPETISRDTVVEAIHQVTRPEVR